MLVPIIWNEIGPIYPSTYRDEDCLIRKFRGAPFVVFISACGTVAVPKVFIHFRTLWDCTCTGINFCYSLSFFA